MHVEKGDIDFSLVNPFLGAAFDVFKKFFQIELQKGKISLKKDPSASNEIAIIIGISGDAYTGVVVYSMKRYTASKIVQQFDKKYNVSEKDSSFADALGEIGNIISGNATIEFAKRGIALAISIPSVIVGKAFEIHLLEQTTLSADMVSPFGTIEINVAIKEK